MNIRAPHIRSSICLMRGWGYRFLTVTELSTRQSTQIRSPPSVFFANNIGAAADDDDRWMEPFDRFFCMYAFRVRSSTSERLKICPTGIFNSGSRSIAWSIGRCGASVSAVVLVKTSTNSEYLAGMQFLSSVGTLPSSASDPR